MLFGNLKGLKMLLCLMIVSCTGTGILGVSDVNGTMTQESEADTIGRTSSIDENMNLSNSRLGLDFTWSISTGFTSKSPLHDNIRNITTEPSQTENSDKNGESKDGLLNLTTYNENITKHVTTVKSHGTNLMDIYNVGKRVLYDITIYVGILGNSFAFLVLCRKEMRKQPTTVFLRVLVLFDVLFLLSVEIFTNKEVINLNTITCKTGIFWVMASTFFCKYVLVILNIDRFLAVFYPIKWKAISNRKTRNICLVILFILVSGLFSFYSYFYKIIPNVYWPCSVTDSGFIKVNSWLEIILNTVAAVCIAFCSVSISVQLWRTSSQKADMVSEETRERNRQQARGMTLTLIAVSMAYLFLTSPLYIVDTFVVGGEITRFQIPFDVLWLMIMMNHSIDFVLYALAGKQFREGYKAMFLEAKTCLFKRQSTTENNTENS